MKFDTKSRLKKTFFTFGTLMFLLVFFLLTHIIFLPKEVIEISLNNENADTKNSLDSFVESIEETFDFIEEAEAESQFFILNKEEGDMKSAVPKELSANVSVKKLAPSKKVQGRGYITLGIVASRPLTYKLDNYGRMICEKEKDKPGISTQQKPIHIDMECCLDPDEIPNPYCHYYQKKHLNLLDDYIRKKDKMIRRYLDERGL